MKTPKPPKCHKVWHVTVEYQTHSSGLSREKRFVSGADIGEVDAKIEKAYEVRAEVKVYEVLEHRLVLEHVL